MFCRNVDTDLPHYIAYTFQSAAILKLFSLLAYLSSLSVCLLSVPGPIPYPIATLQLACAVCFTEDLTAVKIFALSTYVL